MKKISIRWRFAISISALVLICAITNIGVMAYKIHDVSILSNKNITESKDQLVENETKREEALKDAVSGAGILNSQSTYSQYEQNIKNNHLTNADIAYENALLIMEDSYHELIKTEIYNSLLITILAMIFSYWLSGYLLKPFTELTSDIEGVNANKLNNALSINNEYDEIGKIKIAINATLARLDEIITKQRNFAANVSHELKTPLAVMKAYAQVLDEDSSKEEFMAANEVQVKNIERMNNLINDFMTYVNNDEIVYEKVNLKTVVEELIEDFEDLAKEKNIEFKVDVPDIVIESNLSLFRRLISNLIKNAIRYNKINGHIYITYEKNTISVRDTGIGIPEDKIKDIFEPLFCVDQSRSRELGGSGLGLAIVKNICDVLNYKIEVYSSLTHGTEFIIKL